MATLQDLDEQLEELRRIGRRRALRPGDGQDFASNDYLALAGSSALRRAISDALARGVPVGSGGSRLLRGNHGEHEALEEEAAAWIGAEAALFFSSGYAANAALLSTLPQRGDLIVYDALVHASAHEGLRLARAESRSASHNQVGAFEDAILEWRRSGGRGRPWIAVESLYSMDGDRAPLAELAALAAAHDAMLVIDEAHATGVFGPEGRGLAAALQGQPNVISLHTCGKALGAEGALVCGAATVRDFLINRGRAFIFSTAPSPLIASAVRTSIALVRSAEAERRRLLALAAHAERRMAAFGVTASGSQILPLILGTEAKTMDAAARIQQAGFDVRGIRPPTVPPGSSRLRLSITLNVDEAAVDALAVVLEEVVG